MILVVGVEDVTIHGTHGLYPEEKTLGNTFLVTVKVAYAYNAAEEIYTIEQTVDYSLINDIIREEFEGHINILETIVQKIQRRIDKLWPGLEGILIEIKKLKPMTMPQVAATIVAYKSGCFTLDNN